MDATQTSEPTEAGPGSAPGQASAYRRALDDQAINTEGPLDLTVPLDLAKIRAAMATTGPLRRVGLTAYAAPKNASAGSAHPGRGHRRIRHAAVPSRRIGRIALFVAVTAALSVGTAWTLVASTNAQNTSVSLPSSGAIPVAPSAKDPQSGGNAVNSGSTSATAAPSLSRSPVAHPPVPVVHPTTHPASVSVSPTPSASVTYTATTDPTATSTAGGTATATAPAGSGPSYGPGPTPTVSWQVLYQDAGETSAEQQETTSVQGLLLNLGYLTPWRHRSYIDSYSSSYTASSDPSGYYGSATSDAVAQFQQEYSVQYTNQLGACDAATYQALVAVTDQSESGSGSQSQPQSGTQSQSAGG